MLTRRPQRTEEPLLDAPPCDDPVVGVPEAPATHLPSRSARERIDVRVAVGIGVAWFVLTGIAAALEPTARQPDPAYASVLAYGMDILFVGMLVGLAMRRRWGLVLSFAGAAVVTALSVACPTSGHHGFGLWWFGQMACVLALVAGSVAALRVPAPAE